LSGSYQKRVDWDGFDLRKINKGCGGSSRISDISATCRVQQLEGLLAKQEEQNDTLRAAFRVSGWQ
jgi:hypothetical protein